MGTIVKRLRKDGSVAWQAQIEYQHVERNGHFYRDGKTGLDPSFVRQQQARHPTLYERSNRRLSLRVRAGTIDLTTIGQYA